MGSHPFKNTREYITMYFRLSWLKVLIFFAFGFSLADLNINLPDGYTPSPLLPLDGDTPFYFEQGSDTVELADILAQAAPDQSNNNGMKTEGSMTQAKNGCHSESSPNSGTKRRSRSRRAEGQQGRGHNNGDVCRNVPSLSGARMITDPTILDDLGKVPEQDPKTCPFTTARFPVCAPLIGNVKEGSSVSDLSRPISAVTVPNCNPCKIFF